MKIELNSYETYWAEKILGLKIKAGENTTETVKVEQNYSTTIISIDSSLTESIINAIEPVANYTSAAIKAFMAMYAKCMVDLEELANKHGEFKKEGATDGKKEK